MPERGKKRAWRLLSHEAFFRLSTADKIAYLKAAIQQYGVHVDVVPPKSSAGKRKR
jgi:hypothetical protein